MTRSDRVTAARGAPRTDAPAPQPRRSPGGWIRSLARRARRGVLGVPFLIACLPAALSLVLGVVLLGLAVLAGLVAWIASMSPTSWVGPMAAAGAALDVTAASSFGMLLWLSGLPDAWRHPPRWGSTPVARAGDYLLRGLGTLAVAAAALICVVCTWVVLANVVIGAHELLVDGTVGEPARTGVLVSAVLSLVAAIPAVVITKITFRGIRFAEP